MTTTELNIIITEENCNSIIDQMTEENQVFTLDCMDLNPEIAEMTRGGYELQIYKVNVENQDVFLFYMEDGWGGDCEDFDERASFFKTQVEAKAALGDEYNDWLTRF